MSEVSKHLDKNNFHHAYLLEGTREEILSEILTFLKSLGIATSSNPDFYDIHIDNFKMDEAKDLRRMAKEKSFSTNKIFIISVNKFSLDAEHALLKMFEEPTPDTHFFLIVPDRSALLSTLVSRFYLIKTESNSAKITKEAEHFISMSLNNRINFLKDFLQEEEKDEEEIALDSARAKALRFLNDLEVALYNKTFKNNISQNPDYFRQIFQARKFLRQPGSSAKSLMESVALLIPNF